MLKTVSSIPNNDPSRTECLFCVLFDQSSICEATVTLMCHERSPAIAITSVAISNTGEFDWGYCWQWHDMEFVKADGIYQIVRAQRSPAYFQHRSAFRRSRAAHSSAAASFSPVLSSLKCRFPPPPPAALSPAPPKFSLYLRFGSNDAEGPRAGDSNGSSRTFHWSAQLVAVAPPTAAVCRWFSVNSVNRVRGQPTTSLLSVHYWSICQHLTPLGFEQSLLPVKYNRWVISPEI